MTEHDELRSLLAAIRRRWFALTVLSAAGRATAAASVPLFCAAAAGWVLSPSGRWSVALVVVALTAALGAVLYVLMRMQRRPDDCAVARFVEEQTGASDVVQVLCDDTLVSAVRVMEAPDRHSGAFAALLVKQAVDVLRSIEAATVVSTQLLRRAAASAAAGIAVLALSVILAAPQLLHAGATAWVAWFPQSVHITVLTGNARVPAGAPLRISASLTGRGARLLSIVPNLVVAANGQQRTVPMQPSPEGFSYVLESVDRSFDYRVSAGSAASQPYSVTALFPPRVTRIDIAYDYPDFTRLPSREDKDSGDVYAPAGTRVRLQIHADKPLAGGELGLSGGPAVALKTAPGGVASAELTLARDDSYRIRLSDVDGLRSVGEVEYFIRIMDDRPPTVRIVRPSGDQGITPLEEVAIEARADDDYGIAQFELVYAVAGRPARAVPFGRLAGTEVARIGSHLLAAEELGVQPGDVITYYARARDVARGKRATDTASDMFFLEVKPFNEEFVSAQSQAMGGGGSATQIDSLIAAQKEIINATWNLERRSQAGRSDADIKAIGEAQAELRQRAEQMAGGGRRGGRGLFPPQQIAPPARGQRPPGAGDPVAGAVEAMGRAVDQLRGSRTADAIPHEMAALQGLLQAQAEVRRRQVMQQAASGAGQGGSNRADRDLSALFDRELQRQQRTNYETPQQSNETPEAKESDALDRIRDLARRQEEMARRQRELAGARLDPEEMKRQLERLTREQQELRQQAEALQKQLQGAAGASGASGRSAPADSGQQNSQGVQRAAEQMRNAASEMQRQNAGSAASSGEKAAEALRQLERQMRGASADGRQRTAGELQLEAQQIADGQRRVAAETSRLEKERQAGGRGADDSLRRLAADKEKLADRVDELQRRAQEAERDARGPEGTRFRDAARQLQGQQIGRRMRESAAQLRGGKPRPEGARAGGGQRSGGADTGAPPQGEVDRQLTRALDGVVHALGGSAQDDAGKLSEQLDRTREMRDRLNRLERQVRDAEAQERAEGQEAGGGRNAAPRGQGASPGAGQRLQQAREEYAREMQRSRESLSRMEAAQRDGQDGATPEQHEFSRSAPGNEAFKQDFSRWESLRKDIDQALEQYETAASARLARKTTTDRLNAGGSDQVPEAYRPLVSRYFESIARVKK